MCCHWPARHPTLLGGWYSPGNGKGVWFEVMTGVNALQGLLQWSREDSVVMSASQSLHSQETPVLLLPCAASVVVVYCNGDVGVVNSSGGVVNCSGGVVGNRVCSLVPKRRKDWALSEAVVSCDRTVCVVGTARGTARDTARDVTIGIAELEEGKLKQPFVTSVQSRGAELVSSCVCEDKLLLLCESCSVCPLHLLAPLAPLSSPSIPPTLPPLPSIPFPSPSHPASLAPPPLLRLSSPFPSPFPPLLP